MVEAGATVGGGVSPVHVRGAAVAEGGLVRGVVVAVETVWRAVIADVCTGLVLAGWAVADAIHIHIV